MKIFSEPGIAFPELDSPAIPPGPITRIETETELGLSFPGQFGVFAGFAQLSPGNLSSTMFDRCLKRILIHDTQHNTWHLPPNTTPYKAIADEYALLKANALNSAYDQNLFFEYRLYFYISLFHFSVWSCKLISDLRNQGPEKALYKEYMDSKYIDYIKSILKDTYFSEDLRIAPALIDDESFDSLFAMDGWLIDMISGLGPIVSGTDSSADDKKTYKNIIQKDGTPARLYPISAAKFRLSVVKELRRQCYSVIENDIKQFLGRMMDLYPNVGKDMVQDYGNLTQYAVGDGGDSACLFGKADYGLLFTQYALAPARDDPVMRFIDAVDLLKADEKKVSVTFMYYGMDNDFVAADLRSSAPSIYLHGYEGKNEKTLNPDLTRLSAMEKDQHVFTRNAISERDTRRTVKMSDLGDGVDSLKCDLRSNSEFGSAEEMMFLVFKHRMEDPRRNVVASDTISISAERQFIDNQFQLVVSPASGQVPAVVTPVPFAQPGRAAALAAALAASPGFDIDSVIEGLGIGEPLPTNGYGKGGRALKRAEDQSDRPPGQGYDPLRHGYGWMDWIPASQTQTGWLMCYSAGFASPLRCTWKQQFPLAQQNLLATYLEDLVTKDSDGEPVYNCLLSAFRGFSLFHSMITTLTDELDLLGTPAAATAKQALLTHLRTQAHVYVILPTGAPMAPTPLTYQNIEPFYFP